MWLPMKPLLVFSSTIVAVFANNNTIINCSIQVGENEIDALQRRIVRMDFSEDCVKKEYLNVDIGDRTRSFNRVDVKISKKGNFGSSQYVSWMGEDDSDGSIVSLVRSSKGRIAGSMVDLTTSNVFQFQSYQDSDVVTIIPSSAFDEEIDMIPPNNLTSNATMIMEEGDNASLNNTIEIVEDGSSLDIMVIWTRTAECEAFGLNADCEVSNESKENMEAIVHLAISETNFAFKASGVHTKLHLVHSYRHPTYVKDSFDTDVNNAKKTMMDMLHDLSGDSIADVQSNRVKYGADLVSMIAGGLIPCGIGWIGPGKDYMFSITKWSCSTGYYSFGHEIGHNLGLLHDRGTHDHCNTLGYNYGFRDPDAKFRTLLAYGCTKGQCDENVGGSCSRILRYSNTKYLYDGKALGSKTENAAKAINDVRVEVANYFHSVSNTLPVKPECNDSPFRFKIEKWQGQTKSIIAKDCAWVRERNTKKRCRYKGVSEICPLTCGTCYVCKDSSNRFRFTWKGKKISRDCLWVRNKQTKMRCLQPGVSDTCRSTCGNCMFLTSEH